MHGSASGLSPIAIFAFRRPEHLRQTLDGLARCPEAADSQVTLFCDGPRRTEDEARVARTRDVARSARGFGSVEIIERERNLGLSASIRDGVGQMLRRHGKVVVVEDDLVVSPAFLTYMNRGLERYADDGRVASIHGYCYPVDRPLADTFFLRGADCWGWGTWRRVWEHTDFDGSRLLQRLNVSGMMRDFDHGGAGGFKRMLMDQIGGRNDSWAVRWHASTYLDKMFTLYPGRSLVRNIGIDGSGTHCGSTGAEQANFDAGLAMTCPQRFPLEVAEDPEAREAFTRHFFASRTFIDRMRIRLGLSR